jgi:predicted ABC-class ATPase
VSVLEDVRARRDADEERRALRRYRRELARDERLYDEAYRMGLREGRAEARRRARSRRAAATARAARTVAAPLRAQAGQGVRFLALSLATVALYLVLTNAPYVSGFLGGIARALRWLARPDAVIPYKEH